jgi:hypothetical protein
VPLTAEAVDVADVTSTASPAVDACDSRLKQNAKKCGRLSGDLPFYRLDFKVNSDFRSKTMRSWSFRASATFQLAVVHCVRANTCAPNKVSHEAPIRLSALPHANEAELSLPESCLNELRLRHRRPWILSTAMLIQFILSHRAPPHVFSGGGSCLFAACTKLAKRPYV